MTLRGSMRGVGVGDYLKTLNARVAIFDCFQQRIAKINVEPHTVTPEPLCPLPPLPFPKKPRRPTVGDDERRRDQGPDTLRGVKSFVISCATLMKG